MTHTHEPREPIEVIGCPQGHPTPITIVSVTVQHPEALYLYPGIATRIDGRLIDWELSCGCWLKAAEFELHVNPMREGYLPRFIPRSDP